MFNCNVALFLKIIQIARPKEKKKLTTAYVTYVMMAQKEKSPSEWSFIKIEGKHPFIV